MQLIFAGALGMVVFFLCLALSGYIGYKLGSRARPEEKLREKDELKRRMEGLQNIMNYDINKAMGVKHE